MGKLLSCRDKLMWRVDSLTERVAIYCLESKVSSKVKVVEVIAEDGESSCITFFLQIQIIEGTLCAFTLHVVWFE